MKTEVEEELSSHPAEEQQTGTSAPTKHEAFELKPNTQQRMRADLSSTASSAHQDYNSQNAPAAAAVELPGGSSPPEPVAPLVPPLSPATPPRPEIIPKIQSEMFASCSSNQLLRL